MLHAPLKNTESTPELLITTIVSLKPIKKRKINSLFLQFALYSHNN